MVQRQYDINPQRGYVGAIAYGRGPEPVIDLVPAQVPANGRNPRPGDTVYWDAASNGAAVVTSDNQAETGIGIVTFFPGQVAEMGSVPSGANSAGFVEYEDGENMPIVRAGAVWLLAGAALEYGNLLRQNFTAFDYETTAKPNSFDTIIAMPIECADVSVSDGGIFVARLGIGRVF